MRFKLVALCISCVAIDAGAAHSMDLTAGDRACIAATSKSIPYSGLNFTWSGVQAVNPKYAAAQLVAGLGLEATLAYAQIHGILSTKTSAQIELIAALGRQDIALAGLADTLRREAIWVAQPMLASSEPGVVAEFRAYCMVFRNGDLLLSPAASLN